VRFVYEPSKENQMNIHALQSAAAARRARSSEQGCRRSAPAPAGQRAWSRRQFVRTTAGAAILGATWGAGLWRPQPAIAHNAHEPVHIPGGTPVLGGAFHVFGPGTIDPPDAEPSTITDFNGFIGLAFISGTVTRTNTKTGEVRTLPFVDSDMRFMQGTFRGTDGQVHQGAFGFV
jgi:hypothetical protein